MTDRYRVAGPGNQRTVTRRRNLYSAISRGLPGAPIFTLPFSLFLIAYIASLATSSSAMSTSIPVKDSDLTAPTPQNTPLQTAPIAQGLSRPTVPDITEDAEEDSENVVSPATVAQQAMFGLVQGRLATLLGKSSGYVEALPTEVKRSVEGLKGLQVKFNELQNQYKREAWELEKKVRPTKSSDYAIRADLAVVVS
jgi:hypothetical protein